MTLGPPPPEIHDEFSYLLAGDTFAQGRLANPPHPLWEHFETFHVLSRPTYASKYQPASGLFLATGQVLSGFPIVGVWLSLALAIAAVCWALRAWQPAGWSFVGAMILGASALVVVRWGDTYWGGAAPLLGGALVLGAVGRLCRRARGRDGALLGLGLVVLVLSRPVEGALASIPAIVMLLASAWRDRPLGAARWRRPALGFAVVSILGAAFMGYYNDRVTGSPWTLPYTAHSREYTNLPLFGWSPLGPHRSYRHEVIDRFYREAEQLYILNVVAPERWHFKESLVRRHVFRPFLGYSLLLPLLLAVSRPRPVVAMALASCLLVLGSSLAYYATFSHYFAAAGTALFLLVTMGLRRLAAIRGPVGAVLVGAVAFSTAAEATQNAWADLSRAAAKRQSWAGTRARMEAQLERLPGRDVVVVRYEKGHNVHEEWVYNRADIDASPVVWAREMGELQDQQLLEYFAGRRAWLLVVGPERVVLVPHPRATLPTGAGLATLPD